MKTGIYPGSFDPFTVGHLDVLRRACGMLDHVYVAVLNNPAKESSFSVEERMELIRVAVAEAGLKNVQATSFDGLLAEFVRQLGVGYIVRGLRAVTDFEYEFQIDAMNRRLAPDVDTVYFMANPEHSFLSSRMIREVAAYGGCISGLVSAKSEKFIAERLSKR
ncbi:MAG: pantetheine-phosphate adenylyltransferase [Bacillota bacterium]